MQTVPGPEYADAQVQTFKRNYGSEMKKIKEFELLCQEIEKFPDESEGKKYRPSDEFTQRIDHMRTSFYQQVDAETEPIPLKCSLFYWNDSQQSEAELSATKNIVFRTNAAPKSSSTHNVLQSLRSGALADEPLEFPVVVLPGEHDGALADEPCDVEFPVLFKHK